MRCDGNSIECVVRDQMNDSSGHKNAVTVMKWGMRTTMKHFRIADDPTDIGTVCIQQVSHLQSAFRAAYSRWGYFYEQFNLIAALWQK